MSYENPIKTWRANLNGTVNLLECLRLTKKKTTAVLITSDKAYQNLEIKRGYVENDILKGADPYGASKSSADIAINSYFQSFFSKKNSKVSIAVARAGNVIGGGDWSPNRIVTDCVNSWFKNKKVIIRSPYSTRPWQHVLDVIFGYLKLAIKLKNNSKLNGEAFNFGPDKNNIKVIDVLNKMKFFWPDIGWKIKKQNDFKEHNLLHLHSNKAKKILGWSTNLNFDDSIKFTVEWYKNYLDNKKNIYKYSLKQISNYQKIVKNNF